MVWGQDLDTRVQLNWEQLPISRIPDPKSRKAEVLNALELLYGEQLFEDEATLDDNGYPTIPTLLKMFGVTKRTCYWKPKGTEKIWEVDWVKLMGMLGTEQQKKKIQDMRDQLENYNESERKDVLGKLKQAKSQNNEEDIAHFQDANGDRWRPVQDFVGLFGENGPAVKKAASAKTENVFAALALLLKESVKMRRALQKMRIKASSIWPESREEGNRRRVGKVKLTWADQMLAAQNRRKDLVDLPGKRAKEFLENVRTVRNEEAAIRQTIDQLLMIIREREPKDGGDSWRAKRGVGLKVESNCVTCRGECTVRVMCGHRFCVQCFVRKMTREMRCPVCLSHQNQAFQAAEVGVHVMFQPFWTIRYMPPVFHLDYDAAFRENFLPASLSRLVERVDYDPSCKEQWEQFLLMDVSFVECMIAPELVTDLRRGLRTLQNAVLEDIESGTAPSKEAVDQAREECFNQAERYQSKVFKAMIHRHAAWESFLRGHVPAAIEAQEKADVLLKEFVQKHVRFWNQSLDALRSSVLEDMVTNTVDSEKTVSEAREQCLHNAHQHQSKVLEAMVCTLQAWEGSLRRDTQNAIRMQARAVALLQDACGCSNITQPSVRLPDTLGSYWATSEGTLGMLFSRDSSLSGQERFCLALKHHENSLAVFNQTCNRVGVAYAHGNIADMHYCLAAERAKTTACPPQVSGEVEGEDTQVYVHLVGACAARTEQVKVYAEIDEDDGHVRGAPLVPQEQQDAAALNLFCVFQMLGRSDEARSALGFDGVPEAERRGVLAFLADPGWEKKTAASEFATQAAADPATVAQDESEVSRFAEYLGHLEYTPESSHDEDPVNTQAFQNAFAHMQALGMPTANITNLLVENAIAMYIDITEEASVGAQMAVPMDVEE